MKSCEHTLPNTLPSKKTEANGCSIEILAVQSAKRGLSEQRWDLGFCRNSRNRLGAFAAQ
jgi:hypothetical protein